MFTRGLEIFSIIGRRTSSPERKKGPGATPRPFPGLRYRTGGMRYLLQPGSTGCVPKAGVGARLACGSAELLAFRQFTFSAFSFPGRAC